MKPITTQFDAATAVKSISNDEYALVILKGFNLGTPFTLHLVLDQKELNTLQSKIGAENIDLTYLKPNIIFQKNSHEITAEEKAHVQEYFAKHYSGENSKRATIIGPTF